MAKDEDVRCEVGGLSRPNESYLIRCSLYLGLDAGHRDAGTATHLLEPHLHLPQDICPSSRPLSLPLVSSINL
jgi:hypothetical protein